MWKEWNSLISDGEGVNALTICKERITNMIRLEAIHSEMNSKLTQYVAMDAFDRWLGDRLEPKTRRELKRLISSSFAVASKPTKYQKLAVEALLMIKLDNYMKEVVSITNKGEPCEECLRFYRPGALYRCSCGVVLCSRCSVYDSDYGCVDCAECAWNDRSASE